MSRRRLCYVPNLERLYGSRAAPPRTRRKRPDDLVEFNRLPRVDVHHSLHSSLSENNGRYLPTDEKVTCPAIYSQYQRSSIERLPFSWRRQRRLCQNGQDLTVSLTR